VIWSALHLQGKFVYTYPYVLKCSFLKSYYKLPNHLFFANLIFLKRFGKAETLNGWIYISREFTKAECNYAEPGHDEIPSIAKCIKTGTAFGAVIQNKNHCEQKVDHEKPIGVICM
jgi:hypothetical protein